jgi:hypothetical protein
MTARRASTRLLALSRLLENLAEIYPDTIEHLDRQLAGIDSYPSLTVGHGPATTTGPPALCPRCKGRGCDNCTSVDLTRVEAAAASRVRYSQVTNDLDAGIKLLAVTIHDMLDTCHHQLRSRTVANVDRGDRVCDCSGRDGALVPPTEGGWADPGCRNHVVKAGLCGGCYHRERRWRIANGLPTRQDTAA